MPSLSGGTATTGVCSRGHARRCLQATTSPKKCQCACSGKHHGVEYRSGGLLRYVKEDNYDLLALAAASAVTPTRRKKSVRA